MNTKLERLSQMLKKHFHFWTEVFKDEETGEDVSIERRDILDTELSDEEQQLIKVIAADIPNLTDEELLRFQEEISYFGCRTEEQIYIERVRRGEESMAEFIEGVPTLRELCDKGNRWAAYALYQKFNWGDEKQGIFINRQKAKGYYDMAGDIAFKDEWDDSDDPGEPNPGTYEYVLKGNATSLLLASPPILRARPWSLAIARTRHLDNGKSVGETKRCGRVT